MEKIFIEYVCPSLEWELVEENIEWDLLDNEDIEDAF